MLLGTVIAAGPGRVHPETGILIAIAVAEGENVIYGKYDGNRTLYVTYTYVLTVGCMYVCMFVCMYVCMYTGVIFKGSWL